MAKLMELGEAIQSLVGDGDTVALEGFTHLIPFAAGHEIIRQDRRELTLVRLTPDIIYDQMIGMGCSNKLVFSWGGNPGVGSLHRLRDAVENSWPHELEIEEYDHASLVNRYVAGAAALPFAVLRDSANTDLPAVNPRMQRIACPFTGEVVAAVPALTPDVGIIHAQQCDRQGNVLLWGITGIQKEVVLAAKRSLVTVEQIVDQLEPRPGSMLLPSWAIDAVSVVPNGSHPSYTHGYTTRDNAFYEAWDHVSRDRTSFLDWMTAHVLEGSSATLPLEHPRENDTDATGVSA